MIIIESFIDFPFTSFSLKKWITLCLKSKGFVLDKISINVISKDAMLDINKLYLNHDTHTDVITFDYSCPPKISGEIFISQFMLQNNSKIFNQTIENEILRLISHGLLHLLGYMDETELDKQNMTNLEDLFISMFHVKQFSDV